MSLVDWLEPTQITEATTDISNGVSNEGYTERPLEHASPFGIESTRSTLFSRSSRSRRILYKDAFEHVTEQEEDGMTPAEGLSQATVAGADQSGKETVLPVCIRCTFNEGDRTYDRSECSQENSLRIQWEVLVHSDRDKSKHRSQQLLLARYYGDAPMHRSDISIETYMIMMEADDTPDTKKRNEVKPVLTVQSYIFADVPELPRTMDVFERGSRVVRKWPLSRTPVDTSTNDDSTWADREVARVRLPRNPIVTIPLNMPSCPSGLTIKSCIGRYILADSPPLISAFARIPEMRVVDRFEYPCLELMHHFHKLQELVASSDITEFQAKFTEDGQKQASLVAVDNQSSTSFEKEKLHVKGLLDFLEPVYDTFVAPYLPLLKKSRPEVTFDMLWYLFKPGISVYVTDEWTTVFVAVVCNSAMGNLSWQPDCLEMEVPMWFLSSDGSALDRFRVPRYKIKRFDGTLDVTSLNICPTLMWDQFDNGDRHKALLKRGRLLEKVLRRGHMLAYYNPVGAAHDAGYSGEVIVGHRRGQKRTVLEISRPVIPADVFSRMYTDYDNIWLNKPWSSVVIKAGSGSLDLSSSGFRSTSQARQVYPLNVQTPGNRTARTWGELRYSRGSTLSGCELTPTLTDHQASLIYPATFGMTLSTKQWNSLNNIVVEDNIMQIIKALAYRLQKPDAWEADYIGGKGTGAIILLHGPPGVGKTYTVESMAQHLNRPLLTLTVADIGTQEAEVEKSLSAWFSLAEEWKCILLLDEADVFLERRERRDLSRNALVTTFLRRTEYFRGVLFLTTNRVGQIDDAFISRVHVAIEYKNLEPAALVRIWQGFFEKLKREQGNRLMIAPATKNSVIAKFSTDGQCSSLNGRDIRNALQTAITLAEFEHEQEENEKNSPVIIADDHFNRVLDMSRRFHEYINSIRQEDLKKRANARGDRNDYS